jgi:plasmid stabilization system protein ParE
MTLEFHPAVQRDFSEALDYYEAEGGVNLANRFEAEFRTCIAAVKAGPTCFPFYRRDERFRRIRLRSFPFLVVYRAGTKVIRVILLKHERRHPRFGMARR